MLKCQQFENSESDVIKSKALKRQYINVHDNEKKLDLEEYQSKSNRYVSLPLFSQKESNYPINLGKRTKSLNHFIYISKLPHQIIANFASKFSGKGNSKAKKNSILAICKKRENPTCFP